MRIEYSDVFMDPLDIGLESPFGQAFSYFHEWLDVLLVGSGVVVIE